MAPKSPRHRSWRSMRSLWSRVGAAFDHRGFARAPDRPANRIADFTWAEATGHVIGDRQRSLDCAGDRQAACARRLRAIQSCAPICSKRRDDPAHRAGYARNRRRSERHCHTGGRRARPDQEPSTRCPNCLGRAPSSGSLSPPTCRVPMDNATARRRHQGRARSRRPSGPHRWPPCASTSSPLEQAHRSRLSPTASADQRAAHGAKWTCHRAPVRCRSSPVAARRHELRRSGIPVMGIRAQRTVIELMGPGHGWRLPGMASEGWPVSPQPHRWVSSSGEHRKSGHLLLTARRSRFLQMQGWIIALTVGHADRAQSRPAPAFLAQRSIGVQTTVGQS